MKQRTVMSRAPRLLPLAGGLLVLLGAGRVAADGHIYPAAPAAYTNECGGCHVAYPAALLPATAWNVVMRDLGRHFGADASVAAPVAAEIEQHLERHAGRGRWSGASGELPRITATRWFRREHGESLPTSIWTHPGVRSAANCEACHRQAARGE
jgi:hypothetical protein